MDQKMNPGLIDEIVLLPEYRVLRKGLCLEGTTSQ